MSVRFRPMPGLTMAILICLPILIGLGIWQYQRWQWKKDVLAEIDAAVTAAPLSGLSSLAGLPDDTPVDFRRIQVSGVAVGRTWHLYRPDGAIQWQPFRTVTDGGNSALVGFPVFDDARKDQVEPPVLAGARVGYVRRVRSQGTFAAWISPDDNAEANRWFRVNPDESWLSAADIYIDLHPTETDANSLPIRRPEIANNHVGYMLTWWSFALIMLIIYAILHHRAGRLSWS